jgi:glyoxylase-like metal-dependent hydrolase (beta-lactamase superfamily II)
MRNRKAGQIRDRLWYLGREESGIYLLEGESCSLILSGGMSYLAPVILKQIRDFGIDEGKIRKLLILHAHFDHVGLVPFFRRRYPALDIFALARAWEILRMPKGIETINAFSRLVAERMGVTEWLEGHDLDWRDDVAGGVVSEGSEIDLGGLTIRIRRPPATPPVRSPHIVPRSVRFSPRTGAASPMKI